MRANLRHTLVLLGPIAALLGGCAGLPRAPSIPHSVGQATAWPANQAPGPFRLEPGDVVTVDITSVPARRHTGLVVDGLGQLHVPGAGDVRVGGETTASTEQQLTEALQRHDRLAEVFVTVTAADGHRVTVLGAVPHQGQVNIVPGMRVTDVFTAPRSRGDSGPGTAITRGVAPSDPRGARLVREGHPLAIDFARAMQGDPKHNIHVRPGDLVIVPVAVAPVSVLGQVGSPTTIEHSEGLRFTEALAAAGGVNVDGDKSDIRLIRGSAEQPLVYQADLSAITNGERPDIALQSGDVVFVTDEPLEDFGEVATVIGPTIAMVMMVAVLSLTL